MFNQKTILFLKNLAIFIFSITIFLVCLEISLRLSGSIYHIIRTPSEFSLRTKDNQNTNSLTILCLGDSYTYGIGTSYEYSYPRQLEKMLNEGKIEERVNVQNLGSPGGNSYRILKIFAENINKFNPDLAIVMVGMNNFWNMEGMERFFEGSIFKRSKLSIYDLRIYKLWKILMTNLKRSKLKAYSDKYPNNQTMFKQTDKTINAPEQVNNPIPDWEWKIHNKKMELYRNAGRADLVIEEINDMLKKYPESHQLYAKSLLFLRESGNYDLALEYAKKALEVAPLSDLQCWAQLHMDLVYIYNEKKQWRLARQAMDYALQDSRYIQGIYPELKQICNAESRLDFETEAKKIRELINTIHGKKGTEIWDRIVYLNKKAKERYKIFKNDLLELIRLAKKNHIKLILMTYPTPFEFNEVIRKTALEYNIDLIDNELIFERIPNKEALFATEGHCNKKGYELIADNIYSALFSIGILTKNSTERMN